MSGEEPAGVVFPTSADGRRSTSALGRAVVADALGGVDPAGALDAGRETNWRTGYLAHFRRLIEAGLPSKQAAVSVARDGLESLHRRMRVVGPGGAETGLDALLSAPARCVLTAVTVAGTGLAESELSLPYRGERLRGSALLRRLEAWVTAGVIEPSCADAVRAVAANPEWLALPGRTVVVLGAGAEVGPLPVLLSWGARVIGVDLPRPAIWERVLETARRSGGTLLVPVAQTAGRRRAGPRQDGEDLAQRAGLDLTGDVPAVADWLAGIDGPAGAGQLRLRRRRGQCPRRQRRRRADRAPAGRAPRCRARVPRDAHRRVRRPGRSGRPVRPRLRDPVAARRSSAAGRCGRCPAGGCSAAPTRPVLIPASATAWCPSRARTMPWPSGCSAGAPPSPVTAARPCR